MRIASYKTIRNNKKTRISYAYNALERDSMNDLEGANEAFDSFLGRSMPREQELHWADREREWRQLHE